MKIVVEDGEYKVDKNIHAPPSICKIPSSTFYHLSSNFIMTDLYEPIRVWVLFEGSKIEPFIFFWKDRKITVEEINMVHTSKSEGGLLYHFSVSSGGNYYRLQFNISKMKWLLEQVEETN